MRRLRCVLGSTDVKIESIFEEVCWLSEMIRTKAVYVLNNMTDGAQSSPPASHTRLRAVLCKLPDIFWIPILTDPLDRSVTIKTHSEGGNSGSSEIFWYFSLDFFSVFFIVFFPEFFIEFFLGIFHWIFSRILPGFSRDLSNFSNQDYKVIIFANFGKQN